MLKSEAFPLPRLSLSPECKMPIVAKIEHSKHLSAQTLPQNGTQSKATTTTPALTAFGSYHYSPGLPRTRVGVGDILASLPPAPATAAPPVMSGTPGPVMQLVRQKIGAVGKPYSLATLEAAALAVNAEITALTSTDPEEVDNGWINMTDITRWQGQLAACLATLRGLAPGDNTYTEEQITGRANGIPDTIYQVMASLANLRTALNKSLKEYSEDRASKEELSKYEEDFSAYDKKPVYASSSSKDEAEFVPTTVSELAKHEQIKEYLALLPHLAGEGGGSKPLKGGHLLSEMKKTWPGLIISGTPSNDGPWEGWWSDGTSAPKWSSFFPANWSRADLIRQLYSSSSTRGGRELPAGFKVSKTGDTFFPWVDQTLTDVPKLTDMVKPP